MERPVLVRDARRGRRAAMMRRRGGRGQQRRAEVLQRARPMRTSPVRVAVRRLGLFQVRRGVVLFVVLVVSGGPEVLVLVLACVVAVMVVRLVDVQLRVGQRRQHEPQHRGRGEQSGDPLAGVRAHVDVSVGEQGAIAILVPARAAALAPAAHGNPCAQAGVAPATLARRARPSAVNALRRA
jgi:hypothetical protein